MLDSVKPFNLATLSPMPGFGAVDESKLANVSLKLTNGKRLERTATSRTFEILSKSRGASKQLGALPTPGQSIHCVLTGEYALFDFIPAVIELGGGEKIDDLRIATLGFSKANVNALADLATAGLLGHVEVLCSHYFSAADSDIYNHMVETFAATGFRVVAMRTHAKVLLMRQGDRCYTVESSANLRSCHNVEQAVVTNDQSLFQFHAGWIGDLMNKAAPAQKKERRRNATRT